MTDDAEHAHHWHGQGHPDEADPACCLCEDTPCPAQRATHANCDEGEPR
jgi:hypothetical protein